MVKEICKNMDSSCIMVTNPDSKKVQSVPYKTNPEFVLYCRLQIQS